MVWLILEVWQYVLSKSGVWNKYYWCHCHILNRALVVSLLGVEFCAGGVQFGLEFHEFSCAVADLVLQGGTFLTLTVKVNLKVIGKQGHVLIKRKFYKEGSSHITSFQLTTVRCWYNEVNFLPNSHKIHPIARPLEWNTGCNYDLTLWFIFCISQHITVWSIVL